MIRYKDKLIFSDLSGLFGTANIAFSAIIGLTGTPALAQMEMHAHHGPAHETPESLGFTFHLRQVAGFNRQSGPRGGQAAAGENFQMMIYRGTFGPVAVEPHLMTTLEPWTLPAKGTPQLFQTGETYGGKPIVDRQHPHDLWMEITEKLIFEFAPKSNVYVVGGPVGAPALGPEPFMHRESAQHLPWAPLGHHYQDSTHISMGVLTAGVKFDIVEVAMSQFNGREPDEKRTDLDRGKLDSWASQIKLYLWDGFYGQASTAILKDPEALESGDQRRTTVSVHWKSGDARPSGSFKHATSFVYGSSLAIPKDPEQAAALATNTTDGADQEKMRKSWLVESDITWGNGLWWTGRFESLDKHGLGLTADATKVGETDHTVNALTLGTFVDIDALSNTTIKTGLGFDFTTHMVDTAIKNDYGNTPNGAHAFLMLNAGW